ncbi:MAG: hypothetical protein NTW05_24405 [Pseudonocardiales bacterium]|jgi:hypothetical protein|nr:hypothetical protein [Pseudonocardiales bacterium]
MGVLGGLFPSPEIRDEGGEDGDAQPWRLGPIDLDKGTVEVHRVPGPAPAADGPDGPDDEQAG